MGAICCKTKVEEEGIEYDENVFHADQQNQNPVSIKHINGNLKENESKHEEAHQLYSDENGIAEPDNQPDLHQAYQYDDAKNRIKHESNGFSADEINFAVMPSKRLELLVKETKYGKLEEKIDLYSLGLNHPKLRKLKLIFGIDSKECDYILPREEGINSQHMEVRYDIELNEFYVSSINGSGVFVKISKGVQLKDGSIISFGTNHLMINLSFDSDDQQEEISFIRFKCLTGPNKGQE